MSRSSSSLTPPIKHVLDFMIAWTQVHVISAVLIESYARHASTSPAKGKICVGHSPTRKKYRDTAWLNKGGRNYYPIALPPPAPHCYQGPLYWWALRLPSLPAMWRPSRAFAWARPRGLLPRISTTCASRGPPGLCHVASVPRRTSRCSRAPRQPPIATSPCR